MEDEDKALEYYLLAAAQDHMKALYRTILICTERYSNHLSYYLCKIIFYCKKYIKLCETKEFDRDDKETVDTLFSDFSTFCRSCGGLGEGYKCCSKCRSIYYCSVKCQRKDWKSGHKEECEEL